MSIPVPYIALFSSFILFFPAFRCSMCVVMPGTIEFKSGHDLGPDLGAKAIHWEPEDSTSALTHIRVE